MDRDVCLSGKLFNFTAEGERVTIAHIGELFAAELGNMMADKRIIATEVNLIGDYHNIAGVEIGMDATSRIGDDEPFSAEHTEGGDGEGGELGRVAFIYVETPAEDGGFNAEEFAIYEFPHVAFNGGFGEIWDIRI